MIRVLIASPSPVARAGLEALLRTSGNIEVTGSAEEADVVIADWDQAGEDPAQELLELAPGAAVLVLGDETAEALRGGVRGVLPRDASLGQIVAAVEAVACGLAVLPFEEVEGVLGPARPVRSVELLSPREIEVLGMMAEGLSNKIIAHRLGISDHTVKFHVNSILTKLNAGSRTEAVTLGIRQGLILL